MPRTALIAALPFALAIVAGLGRATPVLAQDGPDHDDERSAAGSEAPRSEEATMLHAFTFDEEIQIRMDGRLDEAVWQRATPITDFTQQEPNEGAAPSYPTEVRVLFDADNLYIGAIIYDDPEGVLAYQRRRDAGLGTDDRFMWILDTFRDGRTGYFFEINAAGLMGDGILTGNGSNKAWDGIWEARTAMRPDGWSAEIRIPFRTLNFNPSLDTWGVNFQRTIRRYNEEILWRGHRRGQGLFNPVFAGQLSGLRGMSQGIGLEAVPSAIAGWRNQPGDIDRNSFPRNVSLDVNYSVTSSLRASASINTDFAEVESDQRQVNLTRFPQRFPEQRDFFLEGSNVFSFASRSSPEPFFSRRIGLNAGRQIPIDYGARLTGQAGAYEIGFYQIGTGRERFLEGTDLAEIPSEDFTVARLKRGVFEQSSVGAIYTRRAAAPLAAGVGTPTAHTAGLDLDLSTRNFLGDNNAELEAFVAWNSNDGRAADPSLGDLSARGVRFAFPNPTWSGHVSYREFGEEYSPRVGFVSRNNFRRVEPRIQYTARPQGVSWLRRMDFSAQFRSLWQLDTGIIEEQQVQIQPLSVNFESGDGFNVQLTRMKEFLDRSFDISGVEILPGGYTTWEYRLSGSTAGRRKVSVNGGFEWGGFWNGTQQGYDARVTVRPYPGWSLSTNFERNDVALPQGDFTADVYELGVDWNASPWVSATSQLQYDNQSDVVGLFTRLRWIVTPGSDLYLVYTQNWLDCRNVVTPCGPEGLTARDFVTLSRGGSAKLSYTYRF